MNTSEAPLSFDEFDEQEQNEDTLQRLTRMIDTMLLAETQLRIAEEEAAKVKAFFVKLTQQDIPALMQEVGFEQIKMKDGRYLTLKEEISCAITAVKEQACFNWLRDNGFGTYVKCNLIVPFDDPQAAAVEAARFEAELVPVALKEAVNPASLKALLKERLAAGYEVPMDLFSVFPYNVVKLTKSR
jgi:hypothetical protein